MLVFYIHLSVFAQIWPLSFIICIINNNMSAGQTLEGCTNDVIHCVMPVVLSVLCLCGC